MPRIAGVDIPADKPIWISLTYIYGVGRTNSRAILQGAGIDFQRRAKELTEDELAKIIGIIDADYAGRRRSSPGGDSRTSPACATSAAIAATGIAARFPSAASARVPTPAPARVRARRSPARRA